MRTGDTPERAVGGLPEPGVSGDRGRFASFAVVSVFSSASVHCKCKITDLVAHCKEI